MEISVRQRKQAKRLVKLRRAERGVGPGGLVQQAWILHKQVDDAIQAIKRERRRLVKLARTPGFQHQASPEEARPACDTLQATARHPLHPAKPRLPRKQEPRTRKFSHSGYAMNCKLAEVPSSDFGLERSIYAQVTGFINTIQAKSSQGDLAAF